MLDLTNDQWTALAADLDGSIKEIAESLEGLFGIVLAPNIVAEQTAMDQLKAATGLDYCLDCGEWCYTDDHLCDECSAERRSALVDRMHESMWHGAWGGYDDYVD